MGRITNIEWCDSTVNGSSGCDGCELWNDTVRSCYAGNLQTARLSKSMPALYSAEFKEVRMIPGRYAQAASWSDLRGTDRPDKPWLNGKPRCIFVGDMGDTFSRAVTDDYLTRELLGAMTSKQGQRHFWMLLTKRPKRLAELAKKWGGLPNNAMAMTTVTSQRTADIRVPQLLQVPCKWRGLSVEPLLERVDLQCLPFGGRCESCDAPVDLNAFRGYTMCKGLCDGPELARIDWLVCGGESGTKARPMHPDWPRKMRDECEDYGVPFFFKQWGDWSPGSDRDFHSEQSPLYCIKPSGVLSWYAGDEDTCINCSTNYAESDVAISRMGKKGTGRELDNRHWNGFPEIGA